MSVRSQGAVPRRRARAAWARGLAPAVAAVAGVVLAVSPFLPWYATDIGPPFTPTTTTGWDATTLARGVLVLGVVIALTGLVLALDARGLLPLDAELARAAQWLMLAASAAACALVAWRILRLPAPAEFLARDIGLYVAAAGAGLALLAAMAPLRSR